MCKTNVCAGSQQTCNPAACGRTDADPLQGYSITVNTRTGESSIGALPLVDADGVIDVANPVTKTRYEVHVADKLTWGEEARRKLLSGDKAVAERFAQYLANTGNYGVVLFEAINAKTECLIQGRLVKRNKLAAA